MFSTTFLGHLGWLVQSSRAALLVDPLLVRGLRRSARARVSRVPAARSVTADAFPKLDAVMLSHEHDDHFDIASLAKIDRKVPIFMSARSSIAAYEILKKMGFQVTPLEPGIPTRIADLEIVPFAGDPVTVRCSVAWDELPFLIKHTGCAGSLFSMVDITMMTPEHVDWARAHVQKPGPRHVDQQRDGLESHGCVPRSPSAPEGTEQCASVKMGMGHKMLTNTWGTPAAMLMCAGGFAFVGDREWLNGRVFCVDTKVVCEKLGAIYPKEKFYSTLPGQTFELESNRIRKVEQSKPFLRTAPPNEWPSRVRSASKDAPDYEPATGHREFSEKDVENVRALLDEFAAALVGSYVFKNLHSLLKSETKDRKQTFVFSLRQGRGGCATLVFEYAANACAFHQVECANPESTYLAGLECWGSDMLAVLKGELGPIGILFARAKLWNALPKRFRFDIFEELYRMSHPLRRPAAFLHTYERLWEKSAGVTPSIFAR